MSARRTRRQGSPTSPITIVPGLHPGKQVFELAEHVSCRALLDRELAYDFVQRGTPWARRGNFIHPVKLQNIVEDMSGGLPSAAEQPRRALISQAL